MNENIYREIKKLEPQINCSLKKNDVYVKIINDTGDKGKIIIIKDHKVDKIFKIQQVAFRQINIMEKNKVVENGIFVNSLDKWIYNLYNDIIYKYIFFGGNLNGKTFSKRQIKKITVSLTEDGTVTRTNGGVTHRKELDNQPIVKGYLGPMYERIDFGIIYLRYETPEYYNLICS